MSIKNTALFLVQHKIQIQDSIRFMVASFYHDSDLTLWSLDFFEVFKRAHSCSVDSSWSLLGFGLHLGWIKSSWVYWRPYSAFAITQPTRHSWVLFDFLEVSWVFLRSLKNVLQSSDNLVTKRTYTFSVHSQFMVFLGLFEVFKKSRYRCHMYIIIKVVPWIFLTPWALGFIRMAHNCHTFCD